MCFSKTPGMFGNEESSDLNLQQVTMDEELDVEVGEDENAWVNIEHIPLMPRDPSAHSASWIPADILGGQSSRESNPHPPGSVHNDNRDVTNTDHRLIRAIGKVKFLGLNMVLYVSRSAGKLWEGWNKLASGTALMNIDVQIVQPDGTKRWERVRMLVDSGADLDLMSKKTVRILGVKMMPLDERMPKVHLQDGHQLEIESYVDIVWFGERSRRRVETRFFVPATERCEFEAILSCKSSQEQGLLAIYVAATKTIQPKMTEDEQREESTRKSKQENEIAQNKKLVDKARMTASSVRRSGAIVPTSADEAQQEATST